MKRDLDLMRAIMLEAEKLGLRQHVSARDMDLPPWSHDEIVYNCRLLAESGMLHTVDASTMSGENYLVCGLRTAGHDYLDSVRNDTIWRTVKATLGEKGVSGTLEVAKAVATSLIMKNLGLN